MRKLLTFIVVFITSQVYSQLAEKELKFITKAILKNNIEEYFAKNPNVDFPIEVEIDKKINIDEFKKLKTLKIGYHNSECFLIENESDIINNNLKIIKNTSISEYYIFNDNIAFKLRETNSFFDPKHSNKMMIGFVSTLFLKSYSKKIINHVNSNLKNIVNGINLENSPLLNLFILNFERFNYTNAGYDPLKKEVNDYKLDADEVDTFIFNTHLDNNNYDCKSEFQKLGIKYLEHGYRSYEFYIFSEENYMKLNTMINKNEDFKNGTYTGNVKDYKSNGNTFTGSLLYGKYEGKGILYTTLNDKSVTYDGDFKNGLYEGFGKLKISKWTYSGSYSQEDYNETYEGIFKNGLFEGKGKHSIYNRETSRKSHYVYDGEFKNGKFDGKGKIIYNPTSHDDSWSYDGEWKDGKFDGFGVIKRYDKTSVESFKLASNKEFRGNFSNGKKNGEFIVNGLYQGKADYKFSYKINYNNDVEVSKTIIFDQINERNNEIEEANYAYQSKINAENKANCEKCNIDWKNSKSPKDDYTLWVKTGRKSGVIMMANGDSYNFDYENGKCKVTNGWFQSDDYYSTFDIMIENLLKKCKQNYCK